jgi:hypothetical protein
MAFYKYIKKRYLDGFFQGRMKIGTLYEYRNEEELGGVIGDNEEGVSKTTLGGKDIMRIDFRKNTPETEYFRSHLGFDIPEGAELTISMQEDTNFIAFTNSPNYYIFCMTSKYSEEVMNEFECDTCIEIFNPNKFIRNIRNNC